MPKEHTSWSRRLRWVLPFICAMLPIVILSQYASRIATQSVRDLIDVQNNSVTSNLSHILNQEFQKIFALAGALANVPGTIAALEEKDPFVLFNRLKTIVVAFPQVSHAFVVDTQGKLLGIYPPDQEQMNSSIATSDWFKSLKQHEKPVVSGMYRDPRSNRDHAESFLVVIATPIKAADESMLGALVLEYKASRFSQWLENIEVPQGGELFLVDHTGTLLARQGSPMESELYREYAAVPAVQEALQGKFITETYIDPLRGRTMIGTFLPVAVGRSYWVVIAHRPADEALSEIRRIRLNIGIAGGALTLVTFLLVVSLARMSAKNLRLNSQLEHKNQMLQDFTSLVSHQLRAPVTSMGWTLEIILDGDCGELPPDARKELISLQAVNRQNRALIDDILNISRLDRGVIVADVKPVKLSDIAERALRDYRTAIEQRGLKLSTEGFEQCITVSADKEKMAEAVTNAISNAIKHTQHGGITLRLRGTDEFGYIEVIDTGEGMPKDVLERLFTRDQIRKSNTSSESSSGLGLYIAQQFMRIQGGDIVVTSTVGQGSTFTYSIPKAKDTEGSTQPPPSAEG